MPGLTFGSASSPHQTEDNMSKQSEHPIDTSAATEQMPASAEMPPPAETASPASSEAEAASAADTGDDGKSPRALPGFYRHHRCRLHLRPLPRSMPGLRFPPGAASPRSLASAPLRRMYRLDVRIVWTCCPPFDVVRTRYRTLDLASITCSE